jgi:hypothetical integral membrane protein (TIGR02206 family)
MGEARFHAYGPSHWVVLVITALGAAAWIGYGRRGGAGPSDEDDPLVGARVLAVLLVVLNATMEAVRLVEAVQPRDSLPFQLSDLAPYAAGYALWSQRRWACALTYYWGITLSSQALFTPVLSSPDFPSMDFLAFFSVHVLEVWAAIYLTWGARIRPGWREYRDTLLVTACWAAAMLAFNTAAGTNYGFVNAKPNTPSLLDLLGPWPWYLLPETALILAGWALLTVLGMGGIRKRPVRP